MIVNVPPPIQCNSPAIAATGCGASTGTSIDQINQLIDVAINNYFITHNILQVMEGHGDPVSPGSTIALWYIDVDSDALWYWNPVSNNWTEVNVAAVAGFFAVDTVAELQAIPVAPTNRYAHTSGFLTWNDGQGSWYRYDTASTEAQLDIDGMQRIDVVKPNGVADTDPPRWLQIGS